MSNSKSSGDNPSTRKRKESLRPCKKCGCPFPVHLAKCTSCGAWDTPLTGVSDADVIVRLSDAPKKQVERIIGTGPWDVCFGGGIAKISTTIIAGAPGAGKSTMSLQLADRLAHITKREVLYIGTEESVEQIRDRSLRLNIEHPDMFLMLPMNADADIGTLIQRYKPGCVLLDSLRGLTRDLEQQVTICAAFKDYAHEFQMPVIIIDHVTKDGDMAGLMSLQHEVDTTMTMFPDDSGERELFVEKNRFGEAQISIRMLMTAKGLILGLDNETELDDIDDDEDDEDE